MISFEIFLLGLLVVSVFTSLTTEAVKIVLSENNIAYRANTMAGIIALILSVVIGTGYILVTDSAFTTQIIVCLIAMVFMSWLCAMVGYDKVMQAISQFKTTREE